jgi:hypothetical protein
LRACVGVAETIPLATATVAVIAIEAPSATVVAARLTVNVLALTAPFVRKAPNIPVPFVRRLDIFTP